MNIYTTVGRKAPPEYRRMQMILATISTIARDGLSRTTLSTVAKEAGHSPGLLCFHFTSKEHLLVETLSYLITERQKNLERAVEREPSDAARRLNAVILAETLMMCQSPEWIRAWCCLWSDVRTRAAYITLYADRHQAHSATIEDCCRSLIAEGAYKVDAKRAARILRMTIDGSWLELASCARLFTGKEAYSTVLTCAAALFPNHFKPAR